MIQGWSLPCGEVRSNKQNILAYTGRAQPLLSSPVPEAPQHEVHAGRTDLLLAAVNLHGPSTAKNRRCQHAGPESRPRPPARLDTPSAPPIGSVSPPGSPLSAPPLGHTSKPVTFRRKPQSRERCAELDVVTQLVVGELWASVPNMRENVCVSGPDSIVPTAMTWWLDPAMRPEPVFLLIVR